MRYKFTFDFDIDILAWWHSVA